MKQTELSCLSILLPKIEKVLESNVTSYEKCVLIEKHIEEFRKK